MIIYLNKFLFAVCASKNIKFPPLWLVIFLRRLVCARASIPKTATVYPKKYAHGFVVLCFVVVMQSFIMNSHEVFIHIHQGCFAGTGAIVRLPQCQWSKPDGYGKISQCITTTKHSKGKTMSIFLGIYYVRMIVYIVEWRIIPQFASFTNIFLGLGHGWISPYHCFRGM